MGARHSPAGAIHWSTAKSMPSPTRTLPARGLFLAFSALLFTAAGCFNTDEDNGGTASSVFFLETVEWGRLVDVLDDNGVLVKQDVMIKHELEGDGISYDLWLNPVTEKENLVILQPSGTIAFDALLVAATSGLESVPAKGLGDAPPYAMIARNASARLRFSAPIDASTVDFTTVQVLTGDPPVQPFTGRFVVKNDIAKGIGYVIFDPTVSSLQAAQGAIPQNAVGFPSSFDSVSSNLRFRIPTEPDPLFGQPRVLKSINGTLPSVKNRETEPFELSGTDREVLVRVARTGNNTDAYGGFMLDNDRPSLLGVLDATIATVAAAPGDRVDLTYSIDEINCLGLTPKVGDVFEIGTETIVVVTDVVSSANPNAYVVRSVVETGSLPVGSVGVSSRYTTRYAASDQQLQICFLEFEPPPAVFPSIQIDPHSTVTIRFDEPIDGKTMRSLSTFVVVQPENNNNPTDPKEIETAWFRQVNGAETTADYIERQRGYDLRVTQLGTNLGDSEWSGRILFGGIEASDGDRSFTLSPAGGWADINDHGYLRMTVALRDGVDGIRDLAGNPVDFSAFVAGNDDQPGVITVINPSGNQSGGLLAEIQATYFHLSGGSLDEDGDGLPDWAGQVSAVPNGIHGRDPSMFSRSADQTNATIGARGVGTPVNEPLNPAGAVVQHMYRPQDVGFAFSNEVEYNMGVAGMSWSPANGVVFDETFFDMSLSLGPSKFLADEVFDPLSGNPIRPQTGLVTTGFDDNILGFNESNGEIDEREVFRSSYSPRSIDMFNVAGTPFLPWPSFSSVYNWRDTSIPQDYLGTSADSIGAPNQQYLIDNNLAFIQWPAEAVPSVGLPLLCRFRTYPQSNSLGLNYFQTSIMLAENGNFPGLPAFRVYSAGGQNGSGTWFQVRPDNPAAGGTVPTGGFLPSGSQTPQQYDRQVYWAHVDFVVQVSRAYTHWFDVGKILLPGDTLGVVVEPDNAAQPETTAIYVEFRGSIQVDHEPNPLLNPSPLLTTGGMLFDAYGDHVSGFGGTVAAPGDWTFNFTDLEEPGNNYKYFQVRATFVANANLGVEPELDGIGIVWKQ